ncbi:MAG: hypothetical protein JJU00_15805 [Opitutales bacterium]|nr:hypothetical protein [Opitutales bacterium]
MPRPRKTFTGKFDPPLRPCGGEVHLRLPAPWRAPAHRGVRFLVVLIEESGGMWIYSPQGVDRLLRKANRANHDDVQVRMALRRVFGKAREVICDETHTLAFNEDFIRTSTRLGTTARLIGRTHHFEVTPPE